MSEKLKMGLLGCGAIAQIAHLPALRKAENVEFTAICDVAEDRAKAFADKHGCAVYSDTAKFLADDKIDVITIGTPSGLHGDMAIGAAQAGKQHGMIKRTNKQIRNQRGTTILEPGDANLVRAYLPYR